MNHWCTFCRGVNPLYCPWNANAEHERATRLAQQAAGAHPAPCSGSCEAAAFRAEIRRLHARNEALRNELKRDRAQEPEVIKAAWQAGYTEGEKDAWAQDEALLRQALEALKQAKDAVADWGLYANEYFQEKHDLQGDLDAIQAQIPTLSAALVEQPAEQDPCPGCRKGGVCRTPKCGRLKLPIDHPFRTGKPAEHERDNGIRSRYD